MIKLENVTLMWKNFAGVQKQYNPEGIRNFAIRLTDEQADYLEAQGITVKVLDPKEEGDLPQPYVKVKVRFNDRGPKVNLVTYSGGTKPKITPLSEETVGQLDYAEIIECDVLLNPSTWPMSDGTLSTSLYLNSAYVTIFENELDIKYAQKQMTTDVDDENPYTMVFDKKDDTDTTK